MSGFFNIDDANNEEYCVVMLDDVDEVLETMWIGEEPPIDDEIQPIETFAESESATCISKVLKLYTTLSSTLTINCFAPMFERKMDKCTINCDDCLRCFSDTVTNWHSMSSVNNSCVRGKWLCMTCSNKKIWTMFFVRKIVHFVKTIVHLTEMHTQTGAYLSGRLLYAVWKAIACHRRMKLVWLSLYVTDHLGLFEEPIWPFLSLSERLRLGYQNSIRGLAFPLEI